MAPKIDLTGQQQDIDMKLFIFSLFMLFSINSVLANESRAISIGEYSNMIWDTGEDPHCLSGFNLSLYKFNKEIVGRISMANGSEEPATGVLYEIKYEPKHHYLSFKAKLSTGSESVPGTIGKDRPSKELLEFSGKITSNAVIGTIVQKDGYHLPEKGTSAKIKLKRINKKQNLDLSFGGWESMKALSTAWW